MKKFIFVFLFSIPFITDAQIPGNNSSPMDYMWKNVGNPGFSTGQADYLNLVFSPSGDPCVAYQDGPMGND